MGPRFVEVNGATLAYWERPGSEPAILLSHATGMHGRCWDAIVDRLGDHRCIALDLRGHGRSTSLELPFSWRTFGVDVADAARALGLHGAIGVGHSMGGHATTLAAALVPEAFSKVILIDPVILREEVYQGVMTEPHFARKRRNRWNSPREMIENFRTRRPFDRWDSRVLEDYCNYGLLPAPDGEGCVLACSADTEASIYEHCYALESNIYPEIPTVTAPVLIIRSPIPLIPGPRMDMLASPTPPELVHRFQNARDMVVDYSHFIPMEAPQFVADQILNEIRPRSE